MEEECFQHGNILPVPCGVNQLPAVTGGPCPRPGFGLTGTGGRRNSHDPLVNVPLLELIEKGFVTDAQLLGRPLPVPIGLRKRSEDQFPLHLFRCFIGDFF